MPPIVVALMLGIGTTVWVYNKLMNNTGGNTQSSLTAAGLIGAVAFVIMLIIMNFISG